MSDLIKQKVNQAIEILNELKIDVWLTFVRETIESYDPALNFIAGTNVVWQAAFIISRSGRKIAITGKGDHGNIERLNVYDEVIPYTQSIQPDLVRIITELNPAQIAINYSEDNVSADGLSVGLYRRLGKFFKDTPYLDRLISADQLLSSLRGRKTGDELHRIQKSVDETVKLFNLLTDNIRIGWTERQIADFMHKEMQKRELQFAWDKEHNPGVDCGADSASGHLPPGDVPLKPGDVLHLDFGVKLAGYSADLQRIWYVLRAGETAPPAEVIRAFKTVQLGIQRAAQAIQPGIEGYRIDQIARDTLSEFGYPEYPHALGHQVGIWAHDGGGILGPRWERYGSRAYSKVEKNQVYTLEFGIHTSHGYVSQEENIVITDNGCRFLTEPQKEIWLIE